MHPIPPHEIRTPPPRFRGDPGICRPDFCGPRSRINGCARSGPRRRTTSWGTWPPNASPPFGITHLMDLSTFLWVLARVSGLASFASLSVALLSGLALRTAVLDWVGTNRALRSVHGYTTVLWMPLGALHVASLLLDGTARIRVLDLLVPFLAPVAAYGVRGTIAIGLGTLTLELFAVVAITGWLKRRMSTGVWQWIHRLSYVAFGMLFLHA